MANTFQIKRKSQSGSVPPANSLADGELAINTADEILYAKNASGVVVNLPLRGISGKTITPLSVQASSPGSASTPAFSFGVDSDTGIYSPGPNALAIATGGQHRIRVDSNGNAGFGETLPTARVEIKGTGATGLTNALLVKNSNNVTSLAVRNDGSVTAKSLSVSDGTLGSTAVFGRFGTHGYLEVMNSSEDALFQVEGASSKITSHTPHYMILSSSPDDPIAPGQIVFEYTNDTTITIKMMDSSNNIVSTYLTLYGAE